MNWPIFFLALLQMEGGPPDNPYQLKEIFVDEANRIAFDRDDVDSLFTHRHLANQWMAQYMIQIVLYYHSYGLDPVDYYRCFRFGPTGMKHPDNLNHPDIERFENLYESLLKEGK